VFKWAVVEGTLELWPIEPFRSEFSDFFTAFEPINGKLHVAKVYEVGLYWTQSVYSTKVSVYLASNMGWGIRPALLGRQAVVLEGDECDEATATTHDLVLPTTQRLSVHSG
jgi:hypothetical protein